MSEQELPDRGSARAHGPGSRQKWGQRRGPTAGGRWGGPIGPLQDVVKVWGFVLTGQKPVWAADSA